MSVAVKSLPEVLDRLQHDLALSDEELAAILGLSLEMTRHVRDGSHPLPAPADQRLDQLIALTDRLLETFESDWIPIWLRAGSRYLGGVTPLTALTEGHFDWPTKALDALDAGVFI